MTGRVTKTAPGPEGRMLATVELEEGRVFTVPYWPELLEQWTPEALRAHLVNEAATAAAQLDARTQIDHAVLIGDAEAAPVCRKGEIGCTDPHEPAETGVPSAHE